MPSTIAVVGAGPGLGRAIARRFGSAGHDPPAPGPGGA